MLHNSYFIYILKHQYKHQILMRLLRIEVSSKLLMPSALKMRMIEVKLKLCLELQCQVHNEKWPKSNPWKSEVMTISRKILMIHWTWKASNRSLHFYLLLLVQSKDREYFPNLLESALLCQIFVFGVRDFKFWLLAYSLISFNCAKFQ